MSVFDAVHCAPEVIAAYVDGRLKEPELGVVIHHLQGCAECRFIVEGVSEAELEKDASDRPFRRATWSWLGIAAAILMGAFVSVLYLNRTRPVQDPLHRLVATAASSGSRPVEARLSGGFRWAPLKEAERDTSPHPRTADEMLLDGAAGDVLKMTAGKNSAAALQAAGVAYLLTSNYADSIARLQKASDRAPENASIWSDLAAARYSNAVHFRRPSDLPLALAAADRSLAIDRRLLEANFNRALILEALGLRDNAASAWKEYLRLDSRSGWANEARSRLRKMGSTGDASAALTTALEAFDRGDPSQVPYVVEKFPQEARLEGEGPLFCEWAKAIDDGDKTRAAVLLRELHAIAASLEQRGNHLLADAVSVAENANDSSAHKLAAAYLAYRDGRALYGHDRPGAAEPVLLKAARLFEECASPMASVSKYFAANVMFDQDRIAEARRILEDLLLHTDSVRYPTLRAELEWELARCEAYEGMWSACLGHLSIARDAFSHQGELDYCGFMEAIASEAYDRLAEPEEGWRHRVIAQESLSRAGDMQRLASVLTGAVRGELMRGELESALSLETIAVDFNRSTGRQPLVAEAMTRRALILYKAHSPLAASALDAARQATAKVPDEAMRASIEADVNLAEAVIVRDHDPHRAVTLLTAAIDYHNGHQHAMWLPLLYLERGRAFRAAGQTEEAFKEFELGIQEVEKQRTSIVPPDLRAAFFDTEPDLFAEAVDLLIDRGDVEGAYEIVERGRARTLREHLTGTATVELAPLSAAAVRRSLGAHELLIEYQLLPSRLAIFYADARSVSVQIVPIQPDVVRRSVAGFVDAIRAEDPLPAVQQRASRVWNILMAPIAGHLEEAALLTVVPDRFLYAVPFAALFDPDARQFLVQKKTLRIAPSGMFLTQAARPLRTTPALVIGDPARDDDSEPLPYAEEEARAVARLHGSSPLLGNAATREAFLAAAPESALIHYAGHTARTIADDNEQLLFAGAGGGNAVSSREIARLHLPKTSLVVLAACGTIRGSVDRVEGVPGVARAFLSAGVPSVVGTLWNVPDRRAVTLFSEFHRGVGKGRLPAIALSEAQRTLLGRTGAAESHPFVWAGVELVGR